MYLNIEWVKTKKHIYMHCYVSLVMSLCSHDVITIRSRLTALICSKVPSFWMIEHQLNCSVN